MDYLPSHLRERLEYLRSFFAPHTTRVYMVGGAVRDMIRNAIGQEDAPIVDLDIEVYGIEPEQFDRLMEELGARGVGKSFFVYKWGEHIDISLPRLESKVAPGHRGFVVRPARDEREASIRRDFRMNALMLNIFDAKLLDFWGGVEDIQNRLIRIIDEERFKEDSLRVLRGMQFSARFGYRIERRSCEVMRQIPLDDLSYDRIFWEFEKMFEARYLHYGLYAMQSLRIDRKIFGLTLGRKLFFKSALELAKNRSGFEKELYSYYFLYIVAKNAHERFEHFLDRLHAPNRYYKAFRGQKALPKRRSDRFLAALAMRYPLKNWLGNYKEDVKIRAKRFGFWEEKFAPVKASDLLEEGYSGKELGEELRRRTLQIIKERFSV